MAKDLSIKWAEQEVLIAELKEHPCNPRQINKDQTKQLKTSLKEFGQCEPIVCNVDGTVIGGHQRLRLMQADGHKKIKASFPDRELDQNEVNQLCIRLNRNHGSWDYDILANQWDIGDLCDWGFTPDDFHIDLEEKKEEKPKKYMLNLTFANPLDLQEAEKRISVIADEFSGSTCKAKVK